ncbi:MAG TPA: hypothetical protein ENN29_00165 [Candidatus Hydrogenedentes bacterium]|nr:hypothetical protein [Candidatus Hydrogenedentota bacterium]
MTTALQRFHDCMNYSASDRRPNHELGVWPQTAARWRKEAPEGCGAFTWNWFAGEAALQLDPRLYIPVSFDFIPPFESATLEETDDYEIVRDPRGVVTKALKAGAVGGGRMCMDQHLEHPLKTPENWPDIRRRLTAALPARYPADLDAQIAGWRRRNCPLILGTNCAANGFYWRAREFMGTEALSLAFFMYPDMMREIMEFFADFIIETSRPVLEKITVDYFTLNEDLSMKTGPLLGPELYREFIFPHLKRLVDFFRGHGVQWFALDTDGDPTVLIPLFMDAGVNVIWPVERAAGVSPAAWRRRFGRELRIWGGVDKRVLATDRAQIRAHLREFILLIEEGGFIPTVDHTVPPDVSWDNFRYYMDCKRALLAGDFAALE